MISSISDAEFREILKFQHRYKYFIDFPMQKTLICLWSGTSTRQNVIIAACSNLFNEWGQDAREASEISYTLVMAALLV